MYYKNKLFFNDIKESRLRWVLVAPQNAASIMRLVKEAFHHKNNIKIMISHDPDTGMRGWVPFTAPAQAAPRCLRRGRKISSSVTLPIIIPA
ncbi:uncharacterized protein ACA1_267570 [Acanthamoeba castellanii str. Neff]|uniref:Uncharacterized protein n=1 Tax=Acanthamoeba castellanii (strain ATCC 30010 / Neff) TaxID=1257118 RepID=L8H2K5_ACACF|nr:uncharacterized protein ACA1_267570 [Acanthamoeba castellanii str. Neff]ELR19477.1 hypothetical protein ACA1_267570 [Acanthamoeba castellanii str. Neff]